MISNKPVIAVPIGDPAGIGPEIVVKALASREVNDIAEVIVIGDRKVLEKAICITGVDLVINAVNDPRDHAGFTGLINPTSGVIHPDLEDFVSLKNCRGIINLIDMANIDQSAFRYGAVQAMCGKAAFEYIEKSIMLAMNRQVDAVATTPINKEALRAAGIPYIGHTEIFGVLTATLGAMEATSGAVAATTGAVAGTPEAVAATQEPLTMFETDGLRIFFLTRHKSLREMLEDITKDNIKRCVKQCTEALRRLGITEGTMAVAGLNPHCGEHGLFGWEEVNEIAPAVEELKAEGYNVAGPIGADSVFHQAAIGKYNSVLSLYHDQGHIAAKTLDFERTISVTSNLPILRTSVDHGTAFDIAGKGIASEVSMVEAIRIAARYAPFFQ